ncbi:hypothetical protein MAFF211471_33690 [Ralstonia solanacearum]|nr:hypothetical protein MAFF211471_33690 [Ralstonia solanacearum]BCN00841.1 hypothetical protein RPSA_33770 [Ralstonia solanacearum]BEU53118.1 hypothetical protein MAFF211520_34100 [Ralstonia pseudosolanacearum]BEU58366.1 hypothetical protein MAFF211521_34190 [Ralstonia pseudosolanacearum]BEU60958.1 hypothetical protein MAFF301524_07580 [Ralstonia pseudosolanacearum]
MQGIDAARDQPERGAARGVLAGQRLADAARRAGDEDDLTHAGFLFDAAVGWPTTKKARAKAGVGDGVAPGAQAPDAAFHHILWSRTCWTT